MEDHSHDHAEARPFLLPLRRHLVIPPAYRPVARSPGAIRVRPRTPGARPLASCSDSGPPAHAAAKSGQNRPRAASRRVYHRPAGRSASEGLRVPRANTRPTHRPKPAKTGHFGRARIPAALPFALCPLRVHRPKAAISGQGPAPQSPNRKSVARKQPHRPSRATPHREKRNTQNVHQIMSAYPRPFVPARRTKPDIS
jgi:hypothetical protein